MRDSDASFYKKLYSFVNDPKFAELIVPYAKMKRDNAIKVVRSKQEEYEYGKFNGVADTWEEIINLKETLMKTMQLLSVG